MQTGLNCPGRIPTTERHFSQRIRRLPRKGLMNENGLLGFLPPDNRQSLPTRLPPPKENRQGLVTAQRGNRAKPTRPPAASPAFRTLESARRAPGTRAQQCEARSPLATHHTVTFIRCFPPPPSFFLATTTPVFHRFNCGVLLFCLREVFGLAELGSGL